MKSIEVSDSAFNYIENARSNDVHEIVVTNIANSLSILASMIQAGRDDDSISPWTDDLLRVMATIAEYNDEFNAICATTDNKLGKFEYQEQPEHDHTSERLATTVKLWLSVNNLDKAIEVLTDVENNFDEADKEKWEIVHDVTSMIGQFKKDIQE